MPATKHKVEPKNYLKNVVKSVAFAAADVSKDMMPNTSSFLDDNKSFLASTYATIRNPKATLKKSVNAFQQSKMFQAVDYGVRNIAEDLRTGNFYNKQREEQDQARLMGFDMGDLDDLSEFGISDNWEEELDANLKKGKKKNAEISAGEAKIADSVEKSAAAQSAATVNAVVSMGNYQVKASRTNLGIIFNQNEKLFGGLHTDLNTLNSTMTAMHNLQATALTNIDKNLASFFELSQKYQAENNAMLKEMLEIQRNLQSAEEKDKKARARSGRTTWRDISNSGMPNLDAYFKQVQNNIKADLSMFDFGEDSNVLATMLSSPLKYITQAVVKGVIPGTIKAAAKELDDSLSGVFASFIAEMSNNRGEMGVIGKIAKYLGVDTSVNRRIDTSKYEKGPVPWDGMSRKALMDVIPGYLSRMESYMTGGPELIYDYKNGKWVTMKSVHNQYNNIHKYAKERALGSMPEDIKKDIQASYTSNNEQYADTLSKAYEEFGEWFYEHNGRINPNKGPADNGVSKSKYPNLYLHFNKFARAFKNYQSAEVVQGGRRVNRTAYSRRNLSPDILDAKQMENDAFADADSAMRTYYSARKIGFDVYGKWDGGKFTGKNMLLTTVDNLNNNIFDYLQKIARELQWQREYGFGGGGGKGGGKNKNAKKFDSITLQASAETARRNASSQYLAGRLSNDEDYYLREAALSAIENKDFQAIANSKEARELLVEIYNAKKKNDSQKMADLIRDHDGGLIDSFVTKYLWNSNIESISEAQVRTKMEQAARDGGKKGGIISRIRQGARNTGSLMGGVVEAGVEWLYAADKAIYKLLFETSIKDNDNNKQYDGFMDFMKGKFNDFWTSLKEGFTNTFIDPIKKALGIDDDFKQRFKDSAKGAARGIWSQFRDANKDFYGGMFNSIKDFSPTQEIEKRKAASKEKSLKKARSDRYKLGKILKQEDAFYDPNFQRMLKDYGLNPMDYSNIDEARQALSAKINEIIKNNSNAKGTIGRPYSGITSLGKGEVVADEDGLHQVVKTGIYNLEKLSHIINTEDANELGLSPGPRITIADTEGREKLAWRNALTSHAEGTVDLKPKEILDEAKKNIPEMAGSGLVGGILSMILGLAGGPLVGAAIGAGTSLIKRSDFLKNKLFGEKKEGQDEREDNGLISRTVQNAVKKYAPDMMKGGMIGLIPGLLTPLGPIGGIMIGGAIGMLKNTQQFQDRFINRKNKDGSDSDKNILGIGNKEKEVISKLLPAGLKGAGVGGVVGMLVGGPFGLLGNAALGTGIGLLSSSEEFKDAILGEKLEDGSRVGGIIGTIKDAFEPLKDAMEGVKDKLVNTIDDAIINPIQRFMQPLVHLLPTLSSMLGRAIGRLTKRLGTKIREDLGSKLKRLGKRMTESKSLGWLARGVGKAVRAPGAVVGGIGDRMRAFEIAHGNNSGMTNQEAQDFMELHGWGNRVSKYMRAANMVGRAGGISIEDAETLRSTLLHMNTEEAGSKKAIDRARKRLGAELSRSDLDSKAMKGVWKDVKNKDYTSIAEEFANSKGLTIEQFEEQYPKIAKAAKELAQSREAYESITDKKALKDSKLQPLLEQLGLKKFNLADSVARKELAKQLGLSIEGTGGKQDKSLTPEAQSANELTDIHKLLVDFMKVYMAKARGTSEDVQKAVDIAEENMTRGAGFAREQMERRGESATSSWLFENVEMDIKGGLSKEAKNFVTGKGNVKFVRGKKASFVNKIVKAGERAAIFFQLSDNVLERIPGEFFSKVKTEWPGVKCENLVKALKDYDIRACLINIYKANNRKNFTDEDLEFLGNLANRARKEMATRCAAIAKLKAHNEYKITKKNKSVLSMISSENPYTRHREYEARKKQRNTNPDADNASGGDNTPPMNYRGTIQGLVNKMPKHQFGTEFILGGLSGILGGTEGLLGAAGASSALPGMSQDQLNDMAEDANNVGNWLTTGIRWLSNPLAAAPEIAMKLAGVADSANKINESQTIESLTTSAANPTDLTLTDNASATTATKTTAPTVDDLRADFDARLEELSKPAISFDSSTGTVMSNTLGLPLVTLPGYNKDANGYFDFTNNGTAATSTSSSTSLALPQDVTGGGGGSGNNNDNNNNNKKKGTGIVGKGISALNLLNMLKNGAGNVVGGIGSAIGGIGSLLGGALGGLGNLLGFGDNGGNVNNTSIMMPMLGDLTGGGGGLSVSSNGGSDFDETDQAGDGRDVVQLLPGRFGYVKRDSSGNVEPDTTDSRTREIMNDLQKKNDSTENSEKATTKMYNMLKGLLPDNTNQKEHPLLKLLYGGMAIYTLVKSGALKTIFNETILPLWEGTEDFVGIKPWIEEKWGQVTEWLDKYANIWNLAGVSEDSTLGHVLEFLGIDLLNKGSSGEGSFGRGKWGRSLIPSTTTSGNSGGILSTIGGTLSSLISNSRVGQAINSLLRKNNTSSYNKDSNGYFDFTNNGPKSSKSSTNNGGYAISSYTANASSGTISAGSVSTPSYSISEGGVLKDEIFTDSFWEPQDFSSMKPGEKLRYAATRMAKIMQAPAMLIDYSLRAFESSMAQIKSYVMGMESGNIINMMGGIPTVSASNSTVENTADVTRGYNATNYISKTLEPLYNDIKHGKLLNVGIEAAKARQAAQEQRWGLTASGTGRYGKGYVKQIDPSIAGRRFNVSGDSSVQTIGDSACGPAAAVNAIQAAYGMGNPLLNAVDYALSGGYKEIDGGTYPQFFTDYFADAGLNSVTTSNRSTLINNIRAGMPTVLMGQDLNGVSANTPYGSVPHYVTATGVDNSGHVIIQDPESRYDNQRYSIGDVMSKTSFGVSATGLYGFGKYGKGKFRHLGLGKYGRGKKIVIIGDSRTVGMCNAVTGTKFSGATLRNYTDSNGNVWICAGAWAIHNMKSGWPGFGGSMIPYIDAAAGPNTAICIWMGTNDAYSLDNCTKYINWIPEWAKTWKAKGAEVYFVATGPISDKPYLSGGYTWNNDKFKQFNETIASGLASSGIGYIDVFTPMLGQVVCPDNLHYNADTYKKFWELICQGAASGGTIASSNSNTSNGVVGGNLSVKEEPSIGGVLAGVIANSRAGQMLASITGSSSTSTTSSTEESSDTGTTTNNPTLLGNSSNNVANYGTGKYGRGDVDAYIWGALKKAGFSDAGAAAVMGNMMLESGLNPKNLENKYEKQTGYTDDSYTNAVDNGSYTNFKNDKFGYGLVQFTDPSVKGPLYDLVKSKGVSIGDAATQTEALIEGLNKSHASLVSRLKTTNDVEQSTYDFEHEYERPANPSKSLPDRINYAKGFYDKFKGTMGSDFIAGTANNGAAQQVEESPSIMGMLSGVLANSRAGMVLNSLLGTNNVTTTTGDASTEVGEGQTVINAPQGSALAMALLAKHEFDEAQKEAAAGKTGTRIETNGNNSVMYTHTPDGLSSPDQWCAAFVKWCSRQTGNEWLKLTACAAPSVVIAAGAKEVSKSETRPGDITFDINGNGVSEHTGIIYHRDGNKVYRIDGNYDNRVSLYNDALDSRKHVYYRPPYPTEYPGNTEPPTESNIGALGSNGVKPLARYGRFKNDMYGRGGMLHTITKKYRTTEGKEVTVEVDPAAQLETWNKIHGGRKMYAEPPTVPPEWGGGRFGRATTVDYTQLINAILKVLVAIANNTDKLNIIVSILNDKLGTNISASDISNASGNSALLSGLLRNSIEIAGLRDGLSVNNTLSQTESNATLSIIAAMNAIASE